MTDMGRCGEDVVLSPTLIDRGDVVVYRLIPFIVILGSFVSGCADSSGPPTAQVGEIPSAAVKSWSIAVGSGTSIR